MPGPVCSWCVMNSWSCRLIKGRHTPQHLGSSETFYSQASSPALISSKRKQKPRKKRWLTLWQSLFSTYDLSLMGLPAGQGEVWFYPLLYYSGELPRWPSIKESACSAGDSGSIPGLGRSTEMATHSSSLAWRIPPTEEPGGLQSMGSQRVGHDLATKQYQPGSWYCWHPVNAFKFYLLWKYWEKYKD